MRFDRYRPLPGFLLAGLVAAFVSAGCASLSVSVESHHYGEAASSPQTYFLAIDNSSPVTRSRKFRATVTALRKALLHRGLIAVATPAEADLEISFEYGLVPRQVDVDYVTRSVDTTLGTPVGKTGGTTMLLSKSRDVVMVPEVVQHYSSWFRIEARTLAPPVRIAWTVDTRAEVVGADRFSALDCLVAAAEPQLGAAEDRQVVIAVEPHDANVRALRSGH